MWELVPTYVRSAAVGAIVSLLPLTIDNATATVVRQAIVCGRVRVRVADIISFAGGR